MSSFKVSDIKLLKIRNAVFKKYGVKALQTQGFLRSPFSTAWFGRNNLGDYTYEMCRVREGSILDLVVTHIVKGDRCIQIYLNLFQLEPAVKSIEQLAGIDGLQFHLPPNSVTSMRLRIDDIKGIPLFNYHFMFGGHRLRRFHNESALSKEVQRLGALIEKDLTNITSFIVRWRELHKLNCTDWKGNALSEKQIPG